MKDKFSQMVPVFIIPLTRSKTDIHYRWWDTWKQNKTKENPLKPRKATPISTSTSGILICNALTKLINYQEVGVTFSNVIYKDFQNLGMNILKHYQLN